MEFAAVARKNARKLSQPFGELNTTKNIHTPFYAQKNGATTTKNNKDLAMELIRKSNNEYFPQMENSEVPYPKTLKVSLPENNSRNYEKSAILFQKLNSKNKVQTFSERVVMGTI